LFTSEAESRGLALRLSIDEAVPDRLMADAARVRQILFNLLGNALKFTEQGEISIALSLVPPPEHCGQPETSARVALTVRDTGIGIPQSKQDIVFQPFTQVDSSSTRKHTGAGLGLGIVKRIIKLMGGEIRLESEEGRGTSVSCLTDFALPEAGAQAGYKADQNADAPPALDILVAEDDEVSRFAMKAFLRKAGHRPWCVGNGRQALEALQLRRFHCLFTDIQMPDMDGLEVVRRIRSGRLEDVSPSPELRHLLEEQDREQPGAARPADATAAMDSGIAIVVVSAHAMSGDRERFLSAGVDHYISKPILMAELLKVLQSLSASAR
jgi:CheY-like chemotaxis protein/anti-sigma regulatory factor (Ser/Thr protein kinase)